MTTMEMTKRRLTPEEQEAREQRRLRVARWAAFIDFGLTQTEMAEKLAEMTGRSCSQPMVSNLLSGKNRRMRSLPLEQAFAELVGQPYEALFGRPADR